MEKGSESVQSELARRHRTAAMVVGAMLGLTVALVGIAFFYDKELHRPGDSSLAMALWITIMIFALGSFAFRRTRFNSMRLQDIAGLRGLSGLLATLQGTTIQLAFIGGAIALMGFIVTIMKGDYGHMLRAGGVAAIVLIYSYPQRAAWQRVVRAIEETGEADDESPAKGIVA